MFNDDIQDDEDIFEYQSAHIGFSLKKLRRLYDDVWKVI